jgi:hypothetical protein
MSFLLLLLTLLPQNENLIYKASFGFLPAGKITLSVEEREEYFIIICTEKSEGFVSRIFNVDDRYESWNRKDNFLPLRFEKIIREGNYSKNQVYTFYQERGIVVYNDGDTVSLEKGAQNIISLIYYLRMQKFSSMDTINITLHDSKRNYNINVSVKESEFREERCFIVKPNLKGISIFGTKEGLTLYYNEEKIPVLLKINFLWGYIEARLVERKVTN